MLNRFIRFWGSGLALSGMLAAGALPGLAEETDSFSTERTVGQMAGGMPDMLPKSEIEHPRIIVEADHAKEAGLRMLEGKHVLLVTDMELTEAVKNLPKAADEAYPQFCAFFGVEPDPEWKTTVFLMKTNLPFLKANYLPDILPPFQNGFSFNYDCWLYDQPSDYYRQHLMIHEMVHGFSSTRMGNAGPSWFAEGLAELLGMHDFSAAPIQLGFMPPNRQAVPYCGRIREIHEAIGRGDVRTLEQLTRPTSADYASNAIYYWSWAFAWFLENHPETHDVFHEMAASLAQDRSAKEFTADFLKRLEPKRAEIEKHWLMFAASLDYDFCLKPMLFETAPGVTLAEKAAASSSGKSSSKSRVLQKIRADHGWQTTGIHFRKGQKIRIRAKGRFEIQHSDGEFWPCEPNGVTVEYRNGQPLGVLQAVFLTDAETLTPEIMNEQQAGTFYEPFAVGTSRTVTVPFDGTLLLQVNVPPRQLERSRGNLMVEISEKP